MSMHCNAHTGTPFGNGEWFASHVDFHSGNFADFVFVLVQVVQSHFIWTLEYELMCFFLFILNVSYRFGRIAHILTVILYVVDGKYCFEADVIKWTQWGCFKVSKCGCTFNIMQQHHTSAIHAIVHILHSPSTYLSMECIWSQERATAPHKHFAYIIEFMYSLFHVPWTNSQERWYFLVNIYATNCTRTKLQKKANVQFVMCTLCKVHLYISWRANGAILNVWIAFVEWIPVRCNSETD